MSTPVLIIFLILAGIVSGIVSAVASMASLVSYPALLIAGCSPVMANITSTAALIFTGPGVLLASAQKMKGHWKEFGGYCLLLLTGAAAGGLLLIAFPGKIFEKIVPFLVLFSSIGLMAANGRKKNEARPEKRAKTKIVLAYIGLFMGGMYSGYFGAAAGVLHLICINYLSSNDFYTVNAMKDIVGALANLVALIVFIFGAHVNWLMAFLMAIGLFIGGFIGQYSIKYLSLRIVSWITFGFSIILAGWLFWQAY